MKPRFWFVLAAVASVLALLVGMVLISTGTSPRAYVANTYTRAAHLDLPGDPDNEAYTSTLAASAVALDMVDTWRPQSQYTDSSGIYLRYSNDAVIIKPQAAGSVIHVMDVDHAYRRYHSHVGGSWGWSSPHGESFRGRGPGAGK